MYNVQQAEGGDKKEKKLKGRWKSKFFTGKQQL